MKGGGKEFLKGAKPILNTPPNLPKVRRVEERRSLSYKTGFYVIARSARDEAIWRYHAKRGRILRDCFASLAMTWVFDWLRSPFIQEGVRSEI